MVRPGQQGAADRAGVDAPEALAADPVEALHRRPRPDRHAQQQLPLDDQPADHRLRLIALAIVLGRGEAEQHRQQQHEAGKGHVAAAIMGGGFAAEG